MNKKPLENLQTELTTMQKRRDEIANDLATATTDAQNANDAMIDGNGTAASLSAAKANRDALSEAHSGISAKLATLQAQFELAQEANEKTERAENLKSALKVYEVATLQTDKLLREFVAANAPALQSLQEAAAAVSRAENEQQRENERQPWQASALDRSQPYGNARPILAAIGDYLTGAKYVAVYTGTGDVHYSDEKPVPVAQLSRAGIS